MKHRCQCRHHEDAACKRCTVFVFASMPVPWCRLAWIWQLGLHTPVAQHMIDVLCFAAKPVAGSAHGLLWPGLTDWLHSIEQTCMRVFDVMVLSAVATSVCVFSVDNQQAHHRRV